MAFRRRKPRNADTGVYPYRNRIPGCVCAVCGLTLTGTESRPGEVKAWQRIAGQSTNWHLACALKIGKVVNRVAYEQLLADNPDLERIELPPAPQPHPAPMPHPAVCDGNGFAPANPEDVGIVDAPEVDIEEGNEVDEPEVDIDVPEVTPDPVVVAPPAPPATTPRRQLRWPWMSCAAVPQAGGCSSSTTPRSLPTWSRSCPTGQGTSS